MVLFECYYNHFCDCLQQVIRGSVTDLNSQAAKQSLPSELSKELRQLLVCSTHRIARVRDVASKYLNRLVTSFPSLMCDPPFVIAVLEVLTLLRRACENEFNDEVCTYAFFSICIKTNPNLGQSDLHFPFGTSKSDITPHG